MYLPAHLKKLALKKWLFVLFSSSLFLLLFFISPIHASAQTYTHDSSNYATSEQHFRVQGILNDLLSAGICQLTGVNYVYPEQPCVTIDPKTGKLSNSAGENKGAINLMVSMMADTYSSPVHTGDYLAYVHKHFGITTPAYAQEEGPGFIGLSPTIRLWSAFRNVSYLLFILAFAIIGLAIMLRVKIDPRTVMTIQNQIPKIIVSIVLITFSYAIAGVLIDMMYVSSYVLLNMFANKDITSERVRDNINKDRGARNSYFNDNPMGFANNLIGLPQLITGTAGGVKDIVASALSETFGNHRDPDTSPQNILQKIGLSIQAFLGGVANLVLSGLGNILSWFIGFAGLFIIAIAVFIALFRLWFILLKAYVYILLDVAIAPLWIAAGLLPGSTVNFTSWFRHLAAHVIVFPATLALFLVCATFLDNFGVVKDTPTVNITAANQDKFFHAPLIGSVSDTAKFGYFIAFGFLLIAPTLLDQLRDILKAKPSAYSKEIGAGLSRGMAPATWAGGLVWRRGTRGATQTDPEGWIRQGIKDRMKPVATRWVDFKYKSTHPIKDDDPVRKQLIAQKQEQFTNSLIGRAHSPHEIGYRDPRSKDHG